MATQSPTQRFEIENGPSKWDLMLALFDDTSRRFVKFLISDRGDIEVVITDVGRGGPEEGKWRLKGYTFGFGVQFDRLGPLPTSTSCHPVSGYFSTKTRKGRIEF